MADITVSLNVGYQNEIVDRSLNLLYIAEIPQILITKADKGNSVVIMDRGDNAEKMYSCLSSTRATNVPDFNFDVYNEKVRKIINSSKYTFDKKEKLF